VETVNQIYPRPPARLNLDTAHLCGAQFGFRHDPQNSVKKLQVAGQILNGLLHSFRFF